MSGWVACLDADVLISMPDCDLLLEIGKTGLYSVRWSSTILDEVRRNLPKANPKMTPALADKRIATMRAAFPETEVSEDGGKVFTVHEGVHPKDRHVVASALVAQANVIVTRNRKDFAVEDLEAVRLARPVSAARQLARRLGYGSWPTAAANSLMGHGKVSSEAAEPPDQSRCAGRLPLALRTMLQSA